MKPTIVFFHPHFLLHGGATRVVLEQALGLQTSGFDIQIITTKSDPKIIADFPHLKISTLSKYSTGNLMFWITFPLFFYHLVKTINSIPNKILYCHSLAIYWGILYKILHPNTKLIVYFHDLGFPYYDSLLETSSLPFFPKIIINISKPIFNIFRSLLINLPDYTIANSLACRNYISDNYHRLVDIVITPGVNTELFKPSSIKKKYLVTAGRLEKIKNIDTIIYAFASYINQNKTSTISLIIAGDGIERLSLKNLSSKLGVSTRIKFIGTQPHSKLANLFSHALLGIYMSPAESFGLTAIECLSSGTPIIGVNKNGIGQITSEFDPNFLVSNSSIDLADKITSILSKPIPETLNKRARKAALKYSWKIQVNILTQWLKSSF
ncbi:MAG: glycosyltransferase family 4 protein [Microgenomates group bacterium]